MTRKQIRERVSEDLEDPLNIQFIESYINTKIQDGYSLAVLLSGCRITSIDINFIDDLVYYNIPTYASDFYKPLAIYNNVTRRWMVPKGLKQIEIYDPKWEVINSSPHTFIPIGVDTIAFYPHQTVATGSFKLYYHQLADSLSDIGSPDFYPDLHLLLQHFCYSEAMGDIFEFIKAQIAQQEFQSKLDDLTQRVNRKGVLDRIIQHVSHYGGVDD